MKPHIKKMIEVMTDRKIEDLTAWEIKGYTEAALIIGLGFPLTPAEIEKKLATAQEAQNEKERKTAIYSPLAEKAISKYLLDPARVSRALDIMTQPARKINYINGYAQIASTDESQIYTVTLKSCTCPDSAVGKNICKHRIALWMHEQITPLKWAEYPEQFYCVYAYCDEHMTEHFIEIDGEKEICRGVHFNPAHIPTHYTATAPAYKNGQKGQWVISKMPQPANPYEESRADVIKMQDEAEI